MKGDKVIPCPCGISTSISGPELLALALDGCTQLQCLEASCEHLVELKGWPSWFEADSYRLPFCEEWRCLYQK